MEAFDIGLVAVGQLRVTPVTSGTMFAVATTGSSRFPLVV